MMYGRVVVWAICVGRPCGFGRSLGVRAAGANLSVGVVGMEATGLGRRDSEASGQGASGWRACLGRLGVAINQRYDTHLHNQAFEVIFDYRFEEVFERKDFS